MEAVSSAVVAIIKNVGYHTCQMELVANVDG